ncbi:MAG TPA: type II toxin-antitoxin system death-on-curing family toxin [Myxococcales bacterium]|nr:type II toxin-antitoxin system death-on-curing family toxin [Myxococcales bacterium]
MKAAFVSLDEVLALHADQISRYGGEAGLRDLALLKSALAMPQARFGGQWLHPTLHEMAAAYLFHIIRNHPFIDGNKRAGLVCAIAFLGLNDLELIADPDDLVQLVLGVAEGRTDKSQVAVFLKANTR